MSNIGKKLIRIPLSIQLDLKSDLLLLSKNNIKVKISVPPFLNIALIKNKIVVNRNQNNSFKITQQHKILWGTFRSSVHNAIVGLSYGFKIILKFVGVGFRATIDGDVLKLALGYSHLIHLKIPKEIKIICLKPSIIVLYSHNKLLLTRYAALIKSYKIPEPYKGKGILYKGEKIIKKEGKKK